VFGTNDTGEDDGIPPTEKQFDKTDIDESDLIGLTGFKLNRIRPGYGNPSSEVDQLFSSMMVSNGLKGCIIYSLILTVLSVPL